MGSNNQLRRRSRRSRLVRARPGEPRNQDGCVREGLADEPLDAAPLDARLRRLALRRRVPRVGVVAAASQLLTGARGIARTARRSRE